jgi:UDP-N-acetylmuramate dehydrogenase
MRVATTAARRVTSRSVPALADHTTLGLGGPAARTVTVTTGTELVETVREADKNVEPLLVLGGGSNVVVADEGWPGVAVLIRSRGVRRERADGRLRLTAQAGEPWDELVRASVEEGWAGLAAMSGIPGLTGATPIQNVGAYGSEVADVLTALTVFDRHTGSAAEWAPEQCGFGFRTSAFKHTDRYVVLEVTLTLDREAGGVPVRYAEVARRLGVEPGARVPSARLREVVLELRRSKGMLIDPTDPDTRSVGSFFVNPFVAPDLVPDGCPNWLVDGQIKLSAAWLIENAGFAKGYRRGAVGVSTKHTLALTNRGGGTAADLHALAHEIRDGVRDRFGIELRPEAHLAGVDW